MEQLYRQIEQAIRNHSDKLSLTTQGVTQHDVHKCIKLIMRDNPDIFWYSLQWLYDEKLKEIRFCYSINREMSEELRKQIDDVVIKDFHINEVKKLSILEQVMYVYKWIALYCQYNINSAYNQSICSVFIYRNSVCTGYSKAAQYLLKLLGIESKLLFGTLHNAQVNSRHCWLIIKINGEWFHLDPTFADPKIKYILINSGVTPVIGPDGLVYNFFCCNTQTIKDSRFIEEENLLPNSSSSLDFSKLSLLNIEPNRPIPNGASGAIGCRLNSVGSSAQVNVWFSKKHNQQEVVKLYRPELKTQELLYHEYEIMRLLDDSPYVIHTFGITDDEKGLIIEQATPLAHLLNSHYYRITSTGLCNLLLDVIAGLQDCLDKGIYYRDLHLNNIFMSHEGHYLLGDFGSCVYMNDVHPSNVGGVGSKWYLAPETILSNDYSEASTVYGVGMLAYFLMNDLYPPLWQQYHEKSLQKRLQGVTLPTPVQLCGTDSFSKRMALIISKAVCFQPSDRYEQLIMMAKEIQSLRLSIEKEMILFGNRSSEVILNKCNRTYEPMHDEFHSSSTNDKSLVSNDLIKENKEIDSGTKNTWSDSSQKRINVIAASAALDEDDCVACVNASFDIDKDDFAYTIDFDVGSNCDLNRTADFATTAAPGCFSSANQAVTYMPQNMDESDEKHAAFSHLIWSKLFGKRKKRGNQQQTLLSKQDAVFSSVFAPSEVKMKSNMIVQVFLHIAEMTENVIHMAAESDPNASRRDYIPLQMRLKHGDSVDIELNLYGNEILYHAKKAVIWQGSFTKCSFNYQVPANLDVQELSCEVNVIVNGVLIGDMRFITQIVNTPRKLHSEIIPRTFSKIFISYSHKDSKRAIDFAHAYKAQGAGYFYDRHTLGIGDVFDERILDYIDSADLFILFWSKNAEESDYVKKEIKHALQRAYPQLSMTEAKLKICPFSIEPRAELPAEMKNVYNFEEI